MNVRLYENDEIESIRDRLIKSIAPKKIYLFGSYARGTYTEDSDLDFYIIVPDSADDRIVISQKAYKALRGIRKHPVDIVVGYESVFNRRKLSSTIEKTVAEEGVLLYG